ncbi:MAG: lysophospholipid acyltransferase family protein [Pseudomonadales bacterium]|nr:lysophospholipid acyltransferase family protein [Pseudomonadales bacterium]MCP5183493.1 lysophospholipid acyltransferase family protein [Pseudomonadales bacterium]
MPLRVVRQIGRTVGGLIYRFPSLDITRTTRINVCHCFPELTEQERETLIRQSLVHTATFGMESGLLWYWPVEKVNNLFSSIEGQELLEPRPSGVGCLVMVPHLGNWEVLALYLGRFGYTCLYDPPRMAGLEAPMIKARARTGGNLLPIGTPGIRALLHTLRNGGLAVVLPDQVPPFSRGVHAPFFNKPALTMTLVQRLLKQSGAEAIIGSATRTSQGFALRFERAELDADIDDAVRFATQLNHSVENAVRRTPAQYQWEYKRFKRQKPGSPRIYPRGKATDS